MFPSRRRIDASDLRGPSCASRVRREYAPNRHDEPYQRFPQAFAWPAQNATSSRPAGNRSRSRDADSAGPDPRTLPYGRSQRQLGFHHRCCHAKVSGRSWLANQADARLPRAQESRPRPRLFHGPQRQRIELRGPTFISRALFAKRGLHRRLRRAPIVVSYPLAHCSVFGGFSIRNL